MLPVSAPTFEARQKWQLPPEGEFPVMYQSWQKLLFVHWRYDAELIQSLLPRGLTVDTCDGSAWVGIVPFYMRNIRPCWSPVVPYISNFLELNVRTYAYDEQGTPGVWFLSLDTNRLLAAQFGRRLFWLPYWWAQMQAVENEEQWIDYSSRRRKDPQQQRNRFLYRGLGQPAPAPQNSLEFFLVERYILFAQLKSGGLATGQVSHCPYQVEPAEVTVHSTGILKLNGLPAPARPPDHALYAEGVDVEIFRLQQLG